MYIRSYSGLFLFILKDNNKIQTTAAMNKMKTTDNVNLSMMVKYEELNHT